MLCDDIISTIKVWPCGVSRNLSSFNVQVVGQGLLQQAEHAELSLPWLEAFDTAVAATYVSVQADVQQHLTQALQAELLHMLPSSQPSSSLSASGAQATAGELELLPETQQRALSVQHQPSDQAALLKSQSSTPVQPDSMQGYVQDQGPTSHKTRRKIKAAWPEFAKWNVVAPLPLEDKGYLLAKESMQSHADASQSSETLPLAVDTCCR